MLEPCAPGELLALRQSVLRPHQRPEEVRFAGDETPEAGHFCARSPAGEVVGAASVWPEQPPWLCRFAGPPGTAWRLRAMASAPAWRGLGVGSALLEAVMGHVEARGGGLLWCNARLTAVGFYQRGGFETLGEPWEEPLIGPHVAMWKLVGGRGGGQRRAPAAVHPTGEAG